MAVFSNVTPDAGQVGNLITLLDNARNSSLALGSGNIYHADGYCQPLFSAAMVSSSNVFVACEGRDTSSDDLERAAANVISIVEAASAEGDSYKMFVTVQPDVESANAINNFSNITDVYVVHQKAEPLGSNNLVTSADVNYLCNLELVGNSTLSTSYNDWWDQCVALHSGLTRNHS